MDALSTDQSLARRTFANAHLPAQSHSFPSADHQQLATSGDAQPLQHDDASNQINLPSRNDATVSPAIPRKLIPSPSNESPKAPSIDGLETTPVLTTQILSAASDESNTQLSSSDASAKPPSLDGKSVASVTTFAMDEKESLRPDDSASVLAIEDDDSYSPSGSAAVGSRLGSETGARAFRDQLLEITSRGPALRQSGPTSRPDSTTNAPIGTLYVPPPTGSTTLSGYVQPPLNADRPEDVSPDSKLIEALGNPRDRIWVLKLEQDIIDFVKDPTEHSLDLPQCNSFYRMLAHKLADYYILGHAVDGSISAVRLYKTPNCRIAPPLTAIAMTPTTTNTPPPAAPQMKILRRGGDAPLNGLSKSNSDGGDSGDSDKNKPLTREQREQRYELARLRILGSAKPTEDMSLVKEKDESRSSSAAGKKKPKKQRSNSDDDFEARSAYSTFVTPQNGAPDGGNMVYYPAFPGGAQGAPGMYNGAPTASAPQNSYHAVYGPMTSSPAAPYPWLQQGYSGYDPNHQSQHNVNDLSADFQAMSFQTQTGPTSPPSVGPYGYGGPHSQQQQQQQYSSWPQMVPNQSGYPGSPNYGGQFASRPPSSASHVSATHGYSYGVPMNQMQMSDAYMGYPNQAMAGAFNRGNFNPQSQAFVPGYQPHYGASMVSHNNMGFNSAYPGSQALQRQNSSQSQASSYGGQSAGQNNSRPPHPLPQPVFSPHVPMPFQNSQRQVNTPSRPGTNPASDNANSAPSSIAKWGTPASLPAKPPPPAATNSFDMNRMPHAQQNGAPYSPGASGRLPGIGAQGFHALPSMVTLRNGQNSRSGQ
ncbi:hypothetical protein AUEXF2481DRAFT_75517 [Aureobasidium subglaciale EXF-2481]|uniref:SUZ domain-containing protein n=1 Tax=Aureobasidium subglaciale (strain EXF-2481) TaxID=1043005 RepID=A0A074YWA6_AURSE|nr:uncharacterized protein AUEXF2481DRAFT_75517 [Aureobasidium subglaciale EXF-2481]KAI5198231.1 hypothetical protein E4T38_07624 [Aureobasidium subglaciale]KAI5217050.1 hypothetical protein E4T40_07634 [Aureobasidium subglaciale]KAI5220409.1 hypothetical protein E4T41_07549 [Aureobasidium subglaciale]KAI5258210.1 hypothetical protein E4T46_07501 [Aureobasidium subglaciale]KER00435.1 hypothetical protein AUEXF2481DRAFT_75517 [Aureobasidium subglaciale EXF-2481]